MSFPNSLPQPVLSMLLGLGLMAGCSQNEPQPADQGTTPAAKTDAEHDPHDIPITEKDVERPADYAAAIDRIRGYRDTIQKETTSGTPSHAHRALDELDYVLGWLPEIAQESNVPKENWEAVNTNAQKLRDLFNQVHANIDAKKEPDYAAVGDEIDQAIEALADVQPAPANPTE